MLDTYIVTLEVRWADLDPNFHVLHSKYYDFGAFCRMSFLTTHGITPSMMQDHAIGPIIFREECLFKREIKFGDKVEVSLKLTSCNEDGSRWSMVHEIWTNNDTLAAVISIDGAWMDTNRRKIARPPELCLQALSEIPRTENFNQ